MTDLVVDEDYLSSTESDLTNLSSELQGLCDELRGSDALVVGAAPLFDELHEFAGSWADAIEDLDEYATEAAGYIRKVREAFGQIDLALAESLTAQELERQDG